MKIEYLHASKYGNGAMVAEEFSKQMAARGVLVDVHHIRDAKPKELPPADLYLFSSPGRFGKPRMHFAVPGRPVGAGWSGRASLDGALTPSPSSTTPSRPW